MDNTFEQLKDISKLEENIYILNEFIKKETELDKTVETAMPMPKSPREPNDVSIRKIPPYDEKFYNMRAKEENGSNDKLLENCIICCFSLAATVFGLLICWIPLVYAVIALPLSIRTQRTTARKMYINDCQEIEEHNRIVKQSVEQYNRDIITYRQDLQEYEMYQQQLPLKKAFIAEQIRYAKNKHQELSNILQQKYTTANIPVSYRNYVAIHMFCAYFKKGQAFSIKEAIDLLEYEKTQGKINDNIYQILRYKDTLQKSMLFVIQSIEKCNIDIKKICNELLSNLPPNNNLSLTSSKFLLESHLYTSNL